MDDYIGEFGRLLATRVRDAAIMGCHTSLDPKSKGPTAKRWQALIQQNGHIPHEALIADVVDSAISQVLYLLDNHDMQLTFEDSTGVVRNPADDIAGEMAGYYLGDWRYDYSQFPVSEER